MDAAAGIAYAQLYIRKHAFVHPPLCGRIYFARQYALLRKSACTLQKSKSSDARSSSPSVPVSQEFHCNICTGFCISKGVMMIYEIIAAGGGCRLKLMIFQFRQMFPRCSQSVIECVIRIIHLIHLKNLFQTAFIERAVMCDKRKPFNHWRNLLPYIREDRGTVSIFFTKAVHPAAEPLVVFRFRMNKTIKTVNNLSVTHNDHSDAANAAPAFIGCFKIYCCKIFHKLRSLTMQM